MLKHSGDDALNMSKMPLVIEISVTNGTNNPPHQPKRDDTGICCFGKWQWSDKNVAVVFAVLGLISWAMTVPYYCFERDVFAAFCALQTLNFCVVLLTSPRSTSWASSYLFFLFRQAATPPLALLFTFLLCAFLFMIGYEPNPNNVVFITAERIAKGKDLSVWVWIIIIALFAMHELIWVGYFWRACLIGERGKKFSDKMKNLCVSGKAGEVLKSGPDTNEKGQDAEVV